jgi:hypothetical protein
MLFELLGYVLLGLLLAWPLRRLLRWLAPRSGLGRTRWQYLRPYVPAAQRAPKNTQAQSPASDGEKA